MGRRKLTRRLPEERVALYAGADKSGLFFAGEWRSVDREDIKRAVRDRTIRLVVATDAACEGLNLQTLGTLINVDLPWNPSRLEQRIGRIKRFGQTRDRVDMLNLVYPDTRDERVYAVLSERMRDRYDLFGSLPERSRTTGSSDIENLDEHLGQFTEREETAPTPSSSATPTPSSPKVPAGNLRTRPRPARHRRSPERRVVTVGYISILVALALQSQLQNRHTAPIPPSP